MTTDRPDYGPNTNMGTVIEATFEYLMAQRQAGTPTQLIGDGIDEVLGLNGLPGLIGVIGLPGVGRSAFAAHILLASNVPGRRVLFSAQLPLIQLGMRLLCARAHVRYGVDLMYSSESRNFERLAHAAGSLTDEEWELLDAGNLTFEELDRQTRLFASATRVGIVIVDSLHLLKDVHVPTALLGLKRLSRDLKVTVLVTLPTPSASVVRRADKRPQLADLPDPALEQMADIIIGLHRPGLFHPESPAVDTVDLSVLKSTSGVLMTHQMQYFAEQYRFAPIQEIS